jgi:beta-lactamase regulating signal transducer with metallopeptidase domain
MITNPFFLVSILISALLTFFTAAFVIDFALKLLKIHHYRIKACILLLAFASLLLELTFHSFGKYNYLNPLSCSSCFQNLILSFFFPDLKAYLTTHEIPLVNYLAIERYQGLFRTLFIGWVLMTVFMTFRVLIRLIGMKNWLRQAIRKGKECSRSIQNSALRHSLKSAGIRILTSPAVMSPMATYTREILIPQPLISRLSQQEFESIVVHELEHIRSGDPRIRLFMDGISAFFWWVPTSWLRRKIEKNQEMACDQAVEEYGYEASILASAMIKAWKSIQELHSRDRKNMDFVCRLTGKENVLKLRLQTLLGISAPHQENCIPAALVVVAEGVALMMCITLL